MRKLLTILCICTLSILITSCKKSDSEEELSSTFIVGKWRLSEVYMDPGDGSGKFRKVDSNKILEFKEDGEIVSHNSSLCFDNTTSLSIEKSPYSILEKGNHSSIKIEKCNTELSFMLTNKQLTIYYSCIEGCGERYVRVQ